MTMIQPAQFGLLPANRSGEAEISAGVETGW
jgi:hypothetical protein